MGSFRKTALLALCTASALLAACSNPPGSSADTTPPVLTLPDAISVAADGPDGAEVTWEASALDDRDGVVPVECTPAPGLFPVGATLVACTASDSAGNERVDVFVVNVGEWTPAGPADSVTIGEETVTVTVPDELTVQVDAADGAGLPPAPDGIEFPIGALSIVVDGADPGAVVPVTVTLETPVDLVRKLVAGEWDPFRFDGATGARLSPDGLTVELFLQDGGRGDTDGQADGRIVDPLGPANATELTITTHEVPLLVLNQPAHFQLQAAGGDGPLTWSIAAGRLSYGLEFGADGVISGNPWGPVGTPLVVQVTDGVTTARKVVYVMPVPDPMAAPPLTGAPLPDGDAILAVTMGTPGFIRADGTHEPLTEISATDIRVIGGSEWVAVDVTDGVQLFDIETGTAVLAEPLPPTTWVSFSPGDEWAYAATPGSSERKVLDTSTWTTHRVLPSGNTGVWSPDGDELVAGSQWTGSGTQFSILSMTDPALDRTIVVDGLSCGQLHRWGPTGRLLMTCSDNLVGGFEGQVTVDATDGSDVRALHDKECDPTGECRYFEYNNFAFSPSGSHIVATEIVEGPATNQRRIVILPDEHQPALTPLTEFTSTWISASRWW